MHYTGSIVARFVPGGRTSLLCLSIFVLALAPLVLAPQNLVQSGEQLAPLVIEGETDTNATAYAQRLQTDLDISFVFPDQNLTSYVKSSELADALATRLNLTSPVVLTIDVDHTLARTPLYLRGSPSSEFEPWSDSFALADYESPGLAEIRFYYQITGGEEAFFASIMSFNDSFSEIAQGHKEAMALDLLTRLEIPTTGLTMSQFSLRAGESTVMLSSTFLDEPLAMCNLAAVTFDNSSGRILYAEFTAFLKTPSAAAADVSLLERIGREAAENSSVDSDDRIVSEDIIGIRHVWIDKSSKFGYEYQATMTHEKSPGYSILVVIDVQTTSVIFIKVGEPHPIAKTLATLAWLPIAAVVIAGSCVVILGLVWISPEFAFALFATFVVPVYARIRGGNLLDCFNRGRIHGYVSAKPGCSYSEIKEFIGVGNGTLSYHLLVLERMELIKSFKDGRVRRFFPVGVMVNVGANHYLGRTEALVLNKLILSGPLTNSDLADGLRMSRQRTHYNLRLLKKRGLVISKDSSWQAVPYESEDDEGPVTDTNLASGQ